MKRRPSVAELTARLDTLDPARPVALGDALDTLTRGLATSRRTWDARYLGLPHASPLPSAALADLLVSTENPELATFEHATFAVLAEARAAALVAARLGIASHHGVFTSGGAESNLAAVLVALAAAPAWRARGVRGLERAPTIYASREAHATVWRAARLAGLGDEAVRGVAVDERLAMRPDALADAMGKDVAAGRAPLLVVATAGTTATGAFDPLDPLATLAAARGARLHVDAAWGGMLAFGAEGSASLPGLARADSVAFDPHKSIFAPLGTGLFFTRARDDAHAAFSQRAPYLPRDDSRDPRSHGLVWSRRLVGLRVLLPLVVEGWAGVAAHVDRMLGLGARLARRLAEEDMKLGPRSPLPVVTFTGSRDGQDSARWLAAAAARVDEQLDATITLVRAPSGRRSLRAAIVSRHTTDEDVDRIAGALGAFARG